MKTNIKRHTDLLPRKVESPRFKYCGPKVKCFNLDENGNQCKNKAEIETYVFLDNESYSLGTHWILTFLCETCAEKMGIKI